MLQNPHARSHPLWGTLSHHHCMHCHGNHALKHSRQVLSVYESRSFLRNGAAGTLTSVAGPSAVYTRRACRRAESGRLPLS